MMHKWESTEKLLNEWEHQEVGQNFEYKDFDYERDEFDNVPPVVPKFLFYLQLNLKPVTQHLMHELKLQTTESLKQELLEMMRLQKVDVEEKKEALMKKDEELNERCN